MHATAAHEFHHAIEYGYDPDEPMEWYSEATATWMETVTYPDFQAATGYVETLFDYPELCLGVQGDGDPTDGDQKYGEWLFLQSLVDAHDPQLVTHLWEPDRCRRRLGPSRQRAHRVRRHSGGRRAALPAAEPRSRLLVDASVRRLDGLAGQDDR